MNKTHFWTLAWLSAFMPTDSILAFCKIRMVHPYLKERFSNNTPVFSKVCSPDNSQ